MSHQTTFVVITALAKCERAGELLARLPFQLRREDLQAICGGRTGLTNPGVHVNYAETVLPMRDGLPKFKDFPAQFGGSGEQVAE
jgi:hypothetical protein